MEIEGQKVVFICYDEMKIIDASLWPKDILVDVSVEPILEPEPMIMVQQHKPQYDYQKHNKRRGRK